MRKEVRAALVECRIGMRDALKRLCDCGKGVLFLVDSDGTLEASLSDGDVRRYLLDGGSLDDLAVKAANARPTYLLDFPGAKILKRDLFRDDYEYLYFGKTVEDILTIPAEEARKTMVEWYSKFYAPFEETNCLRLLQGG